MALGAVEDKFEDGEARRASVKESLICSVTHGKEAVT